MSSHEPHCPKCRTTILKEKTLSDGDTHIDVCPRCRGGWFDSRELGAVLSVAVDSLKPDEDAEFTNCVCPKCGIPLKKIEYPETQIEVDVCDRCHGIWLDRGEFKGLNYARAQHQDKSKFEEPPTTMREAATRFVDRVLEKFMKMND